MKFQARKYINKTEKNTLYSVEKLLPVKLKEEHDDNTCDYIEIIFDADGELYFCEEYRPILIPKDGHKAADILGMILSDDAANVFVYDVKRSFKCDDEIIHFIQQINSTYYDSMGMLFSARYNEKFIKYRFGVITSSFSEDDINLQKKYYFEQYRKESLLTNSNSIALKKKASKSTLEMLQKYRMLDAISKKKIILETGTEYDLDIAVMEPCDGGYKYEMKISI